MTLRKMWASGRFVLGAWSGLADRVSVQVMGNAGFDLICIDLQHAYADLHSLPELLDALAHTKAAAAVRVPWNAPDPIMRALDLGAELVVVPMVSTPDEAAQAVRYCRYAPKGARSWGPLWGEVRGGAPDPEAGDLRATNALMIETAAGLANVNEIANVPGVDALYVGPNDLALSLGIDRATRRENAMFNDAVERIIAAAHGAGIAAGVDCEHAADVRTWRDRGADFVLSYHDSSLLAAAAKAAAVESRAALERPDPVS